jgi:putative flippase GtrA
MFKKLLRFAITGVLNTGLDILVLNVLFLFLPPRGSLLMVAWENCIACSVAATQSFILNKFWTFKDRTPTTIQQVLKFAGVTGVNMLLNTFFLEEILLLLPGTKPDGAGPEAVALKVGVAAACMFVSFLGMCCMVFVSRQDRKRSRMAPPPTLLRKMHYRLGLVLPCYNEAENLEKTVASACAVLSQMVYNFRIIVVNDGSQDRTREIGEQLAARDSRVMLIHHPYNRGAGAALATGFRAACEAKGMHALDLVSYIDADGQFDIRDMASILPLIQDYDAVFGYRYDRQDPFIRKLNAALWNWLVRLLLGNSVRDVDCAFKLMRTECLRSLSLEADGAVLMTELLYKWQRAQYSWVQVPVQHLPRRGGKQTGAKLRVILKAFKELAVMSSRWAREEQEQRQQQEMVA